MVNIIGKGSDDQIQIVDEAVYTSHSVNTLEKGMNPTFLLSVIVE